MPKLKINRDDLIQALTTHFSSYEEGWYLDTETGGLLLDTDGAENLPEDLRENPRYRLIDSIPSHESFGIMEAFVASLEDGEPAIRLADALDRPKPFRRFKDTLYDFPDIPDRWFAFEDEAHGQKAQQWCEDNDIEPEWV